MQSDALGFLYPHIDEEKCINCGLCMKVCSFKKGYPRTDKFEQPLVYAARLRDTAQLARSQSGGMGYALSRAAIGQGAIVYGVGFGPHFRAVHKRVDRPEGLEELRGSKYVQSDLRGIFPQVKRDLKDGHRVLFFGTPCQVAGWRRLTAPFGDRAPACDLVCGGVPSPALFAAYLREEERRAGAPIRDYDFRDKSAGWNFPRVRLAFANGKTRRLPLRMDTFYAAFAAKLSCRLSCADCPYSCSERVGDITIADCWHVAAYRSDYDDNRGTSLLLAQTQEGECLLTAAQAAGETRGLTVRPYDIAHAVRSNAPLRHPLDADGNRSRFLTDVLVGGKTLHAAIRVYLGRGWFVRAWVRWWMKRLLWFWLRRRG